MHQNAPVNVSEPMLSLDMVRLRLAYLWLILGGLIFLIVVVQSLLGKYGDETQNAWGWLLPTIMPTLGMIVAVLGYAALDPNFSSSVVRKSFFFVAFFLSGTYLVLVLITVCIQPFVPATNPIQLMHTSNLWLGPFQGLVASALGVLFVSKQKRP
jgi:cell division protein FtsW (lipid II flippase)